MADLRAPFFATTVNYIDLQILPLNKPILDVQLHWTNEELGMALPCEFIDPSPTAALPRGDFPRRPLRRPPHRHIRVRLAGDEMEERRYELGKPMASIRG